MTKGGRDGKVGKRREARSYWTDQNLVSPNLRGRLRCLKFPVDINFLDKSTKKLCLKTASDLVEFILLPFSQASRRGNITRIWNL